MIFTGGRGKQEKLGAWRRGWVGLPNYLKVVADVDSQRLRRNDV